MKRGALGRRIEYHTHPKYGGKVPIYLDTTRSCFHALIGDVQLTDENLHKLRIMVDESLKNQHSLEWVPIIDIGFGGWFREQGENHRNARHNEVELSFERYWIAQKIDKQWIKATWDDKIFPNVNAKPRYITGDRLERSSSLRIFVRDKERHESVPITDLKLPYTQKREGVDELPRYLVAYTEELWLALLTLSKRLEDLQFKIVEILGSAEKRKQLTDSVQKLLPLATK
jgi:hypothetical protein